MLKTRVLTAIALLPLVLGMLFYAGTAAWAAFAAAIALVSCWEWSRLCGFRPRARLAFLAASAAIGGALAAARFAAPAAVFANVAQASFVAAAYFWIFAVPAWLLLRLRPEPLACGAAGWFVLWPMWAALVVLREAGPWLLLACAALVWVADIAAYFGGRLSMDSFIGTTHTSAKVSMSPSSMAMMAMRLPFWKSMSECGDRNWLIMRQPSLAMLFWKYRISDLLSTRPESLSSPAFRPLRV